MTALADPPQLASPAYCSVQPWVMTRGPRVCDLAARVGWAPDDDQAMILDAIFGKREDGHPCALETCVICARRNIKTSVFIMAILGWLYLENIRRIVYSAHNFDTASEMFGDLTELIEGHSFLSRRLARNGIRRGSGKEAVWLKTGQKLKIKTRTITGGRGLGAEKVILDEGFALTDEHMGSLVPLLSTWPNAQLLEGSSAGKARSVVLRRVRDRGRAGAPRLNYFEYCAPPPEIACADGIKCTHIQETPGCGCDKPELWKLSNPTYGRRISHEYMVGERDILSPREFGRERMGWWDDPAGGLVPITKEMWKDRGDPESKIKSAQLGLAFDIAPDRSTSAISVCGRRADGRWHVEIIDYRAGTAHLPARLAEFADRWHPGFTALDPAGPAGAMLDKLTDRGFTTSEKTAGHQLWLLGARETAQACGSFADDVVNDRLRHTAQKPLDDTIPADTRTLGDAWAWARKDEDVCPLYGATLARAAAARVESAGHIPFALWGR